MHRHCGNHERIDFFFAVKKWTGEIKNAEPHRCDELKWFTWDELSENVIPYIRLALSHYREGRFFAEFAESGNEIFSK